MSITVWNWDAIERKRSRSSANCSIDSKQIQNQLAVQPPTNGRDCNILIGWRNSNSTTASLSVSVEPLQYQQQPLHHRQRHSLVVAAFTPFTCNHTYTHAHMPLLLAAACLPSAKTACPHPHDPLDAKLQHRAKQWRMRKNGSGTISCAF